MFDAIVLAASRKAISILVDSTVYSAVHSIRKSEIVVGDHVRVRKDENGLFIEEVLERRNLLFRSYQGRSKRLAANLDRLFVVTGSGALFNTIAIDRALTAAHCANIPAALILNKIDLADAEDLQKAEVYQNCGIEVIETNAKANESLVVLKEVLAQPALKTFALSGISGVGKSTLLNALVPSANLKTSSVSERSGQGTQTTSSARGFLYPRTEKPDAILFDLPGIQFFGVSHLTTVEIAQAFPEFIERAGECRFLDCKHISEPECKVRAALESGEIAQFRYQSYLSMLDELDKAQPY